MKMNKLKFLAFVALLITSFTSCENEELGSGVGEGGNEENPEAPLFKADFDGQTFSTTTVQAYISGGSITIVGSKSNGENFAFILDGTTPATYAANDNLVGYSPAGSEYSYVGINPDDEDSDTGSVIISSINTTNNTLSGTFSFTGYWTNYDETVAPKQFTNGVFTNIPFITTNPSGDTFDAKINGADFNDTDIFTAETTIAGQSFISVAAENALEQSITVNLRESAGVGTYPITGAAADQAQINLSLDPEGFGTVATSGSVTITEKTALRLKGTFSGTVIIGGTTYQITAGAFNVEY